MPITLSVSAPRAYQVHQRSLIANTASIPVGGIITGGGGQTFDVEARYKGGAWQLVQSGCSTQFQGVLENQPIGQGALELRIVGQTAITNIPFIGVGDLFAVWGQSNARGSGAAVQVYTHPTLKASNFHMGYAWSHLQGAFHAPVSGLVDKDRNFLHGAKGNYWYHMVTRLMADQNIPVALLPCAKGDTLISQWQPSKDRYSLYGGAVNRALAARGVRAVLWHQGESDAAAATAGKNYKRSLSEIAAEVNADLGVPFLPAQLQILYPAFAGGEFRDEINRAIREVIAEHPNVYAGADFSDMLPDDSRAHFTQNPALIEAGRRWANAVKVALYP